MHSKPTLRLLAWILLCVGSNSAIQGKPCESLPREALSRHAFSLHELVRGGSVTPRWIAGGDSFWYLEDTTALAPRASRVDPDEGPPRPLFDESLLRRALAEHWWNPIESAGPLDLKQLEVLDDGQTARFTLAGRHFEWRLGDDPASDHPQEDSRLIELGPGWSPTEDSAQFLRRAAWDGLGDLYEIPAPNGRWFLGEEGYNLYLRSTIDGRKVTLTNDGKEGYDWRIQDPDGFANATFSQDGLWLATLKVDDRQVPRVPLVHWLKTREEVQWHPFTKAGGPLPRLELQVIDVLKHRPLPVDTGDTEDTFLADITWASGPEPHLFFLRITRDFKRVELRRADPRTGESHIVLVETQPTFVKNISTNPSIQELFTLLDDGEHFLWISEQDGWDHLYLYRTDGQLVRRLTRGHWPVVRVEAVDETGRWVFFSAHGDPRRPYDTHLYRVSLDGGEPEQLTRATGQHRPIFSPSHRYVLDTHSDLDRPPRVDLLRADGTLIHTLSEADSSALEAHCWRPPEPFIVKAADGVTDIHGVLYLPWDLDPTHSYPVLDYIYGAPSTTWVPRTFLDSGTARGGRARALAQLGFVVMLLDGRGTPERGKAFQDVIYGNFGRYEIPDHAAALRQLAKRFPYIDLERVGVFGGSWGGYMTLRALLLEPELFKAGFATNALVDFYDHGAVGLEGYLGLVTQNPEAYAFGSNLDLVDRLQGHLLLAHATSDRNVTFSTTMKMVDTLARTQKPYELLVFPEEGHLLEEPNQAYRFERLKQFFLRHLGTANSTVENLQ